MNDYFTVLPVIRGAVSIVGLVALLLMLFPTRERDRADGASAKAPVFVIVQFVLVTLAVTPASWAALVLVALIAAGVLKETIDATGPEHAPLRIQFCLLLFVDVALLLRLKQMDPSGGLLAFLLLCVASYDAFAQIVGERFGQRMVFGRISPKKSLEGLLGGLAMAGVIGMFMFPLVDPTMAVREVVGTIEYPHLRSAELFAMRLGLLCGAAAAAGDLGASALKRRLGLRQFGDVLGPQGGLIDRLVSLSVATPVFWLTLVLLGR